MDQNTAQFHTDIDRLKKQVKDLTAKLKRLEGDLTDRINILEKRVKSIEKEI